MAKGQVGKLSDKLIEAADIAVSPSTQGDLAHELFVDRQARELGLSATHGGTYTDSEVPR